MTARYGSSSRAGVALAVTGFDGFALMLFAGAFRACAS